MATFAFSLTRVPKAINREQVAKVSQGHVSPQTLLSHPFSGNAKTE